MNLGEFRLWGENYLDNWGVALSSQMRARTRDTFIHYFLPATVLVSWAIGIAAILWIARNRGVTGMEKIKINSFFRKAGIF